MALQSAADVPLLITSPNSSSERRISPSWSIAQLKARLEPITGVPASCQQLSLRVGSQDAVAISAVDEKQTRLAAFPLQPYAEMTVVDTRPSAARTDFTDLSSVTKYEMPAAEYEHRSDSVLAWKKAQKLGRFDPDAPSIEQQKIRASEREVEERANCPFQHAAADPWHPWIQTSMASTMASDVSSQIGLPYLKQIDNFVLMAAGGAARLTSSSRLLWCEPSACLALHGRVRLLPETDARRGTISYIGLVPEIPGIGVWIGVTLDEPTGKNDGSIKGKRYFECGKNCGAFVRPERCEAGDFPPLDMGDEDLEEL
ncbi:tubulin-folding cofactor B [Pyrenophora tritici-repentis Pt-1C-BFP]|uniref:Tubulin-folding cofactor B n=1 Tax=Pyrenophora tritici-repentis (strain Pt-1C-BFP) TaxID=426418 RepID=B2W2L2_PYRTR|nr:tubulin-folding cofactor B [Pyrenophora tritici-repentis Pt-1C-BFP]EDU46498.1 tubulin-folding cofactor B [Pyrenophora tritici-repentis Pt-1C-BFP]